MSDRRDVIVIGAGISGLACAYRLKRLGADVLLLESSARVGGVIQTDRVDGFLVERGPNSSQGTEELLALIEELGIMDRVAEGDPKAPAYVYFGGELHAVPSSGAAFLRSKLLSLGGKLRILREPFVPARGSDEEESIASFARRRIGREAAERMVAPFVSGIYAGDAEKLSVQAAFPRLSNLETGYGGLFRGMFAKAREAKKAKKAARDVLDKAAPTRRRLISFDDGMAVLPRALASHLGEDLYTECRDIRARAGLEGSGFTVEFDRRGASERLTCARLVIATPARAASALAKPLSDELSRLLDEIYYPPLSIVSLSYGLSAIRRPLDGFGFLAAPGEPLSILGCVWNSSLFKGRAPEGKALLTVFIGGARMPDRARLGDAELVGAAHGDLQKILGISEEARPVSITRWERAIPQYTIGHRDRVRRIEGILKDSGGLLLLGNYLHGVSTGDCVKEADRHAREIYASLSFRA